MSAMEQMVINIFRSMGFDPDQIKKDVTARVENFEQNIKTLNDNLARIDARLAAIETHLGVPPHADRDTTENSENQALRISNRDTRSNEPRLDPSYGPP